MEEETHCLHLNLWCLDSETLQTLNHGYPLAWKGKFNGISFDVITLENSVVVPRL